MRIQDEWQTLVHCVLGQWCSKTVLQYHWFLQLFCDANAHFCGCESWGFIIMVTAKHWNNTQTGIHFNKQQFFTHIGHKAKECLWELCSDMVRPLSVSSWKLLKAANIFISYKNIIIHFNAARFVEKKNLIWFNSSLWIDFSVQLLFWILFYTITTQTKI